MAAENIVIVGATSGIAVAICNELARAGNNLVLAGRDTTELNRLATDLKIRFQREVFVEPFEASNYEHHATFWNNCVAHFPNGLSGVIVCHGILPEQAETERNMAALRQSFDVNLVSAAAILEVAATYFEARKCGFLAAISSVAGDRGRQSNYCYGAAKAGLTAFLQGLRNRLQPTGVHVLTIKPGFVATRMTVGKVNPTSPLLAQPENVAREICRAIRRRKNVLYTPRIWWVIMTIVRAIPEAIFKRLKM